MKNYQDSLLRDGTGLAIQGATVAVRVKSDPPGTGALATLYSDNGVTETANPVVTDAKGSYEFYVADGSYDLVITKGNESSILTDVQIMDYDDTAGAVLRADLDDPSPGKGGFLIKHKGSSEAGVTTYGRSLTQIKELAAEESDGLSVFNFIDPAYDDAILAGDTTPDMQPYFANAMTELAAVRASTGRKQKLLIPPHLYKSTAQIFATTDELVISGKGAKIISPFDAAIPCIAISANDVTVEGLHTHITGASAAHPWHYNVTGQNCILDGVTMEKDDLSGGYQMFCRYGADGFQLRNSKTLKSNGIFIEASNTLFAFNEFTAQTNGGDDCLAFKAIQGVTETSRIIGNKFRYHAACISCGSEIGVAGAADPTFAHSVRGIVAEGNIAYECTRMMMLKPDGIDGVDYRYGTVEGITFSNNRMNDPTGLKAQQMIQILPGRSGRVRHVTGKGNQLFGRAMTGGTNQYGLHIYMRSDAALGGAEVVVQDIDLAVEVIDPFGGAAAGGAAPGSPWSGAVRVEKQDPLYGQASKIALEVNGDGTAQTGVSIGPGLDSAVHVRRADLRNINSSGLGSAGAVQTSSIMTIGQEVSASVLGGSVYKLNAGSTGDIRTLGTFVGLEPMLTLMSLNGLGGAAKGSISFADSAAAEWAYIGDRDGVNKILTVNSTGSIALSATSVDLTSKFTVTASNQTSVITNSSSNPTDIPALSIVRGSNIAVPTSAGAALSITDSSNDWGIVVKSVANVVRFSVGPSGDVTTTGKMTATGNICSIGGKVGYDTGAGGTVVQATSKTTAVTLNKVCGQITMNAAALAAGNVAEFTVNNSQVAATDTVIAQITSGAASTNAYRVWVSQVAAGAFKVCVENRSAGSLSEALVLNFAVVKAVAA